MPLPRSHPNPLAGPCPDRMVLLRQDEARPSVGDRVVREVALPTAHSISVRLIEDGCDAGSATPLREQPARLWTAPPR